MYFDTLSESLAERKGKNVSEKKREKEIKGKKTLLKGKDRRG